MRFLSKVLQDTAVPMFTLVTGLSAILFIGLLLAGAPTFWAIAIFLGMPSTIIFARLVEIYSR